MTHRRRWPLLAVLAPSVAALFSGAVSWAAGNPPPRSASAAATPAQPAAPSDADALRRTVAEQAGALRQLRSTLRRLEAQVDGLRAARTTPRPPAPRLQVRRPTEQPAAVRPAVPPHPVPRAAPRPTTPTPPQRPPRAVSRPAPGPAPKPSPKPAPRPAPKPAPKPAPEPAAPSPPPPPPPPPVDSTGS